MTRKVQIPGLTASGVLTVVSQALTAATEPVDGMAGRFRSVLVIEGQRTTDDREMAVGALSWRELPIALTNALDVGDDHYGQVIGSIETIERVEVDGGEVELHATGSFDIGSEAGREAARLCAEQVKRWVSVDLEVIAYELFEEGDCSIDEDPDSEIDYYPSDDCTIVFRVTEGRIMGAAMCAFSAFPGAVIVPEGAEIPDATEDGRPAPEIEDPTIEPEAADLDEPTDFTLIAAASAGLPSATWFDDPNLTAPTPLTITDDGRVYGHLATWGTCHIGRDDVCLTPPRSEAAYAYFRTGETKVSCADCGPKTKTVATGVLTMATGHADLALGADRAAAHYDDTGSVFADVAAGEDAYGIWVSGALRSGLSEDQIRAAQAAALSGDWRRIGSSLELVAALAVNVPGFPIPRAIAASGALVLRPKVSARSSRGRAMALVASGVVEPKSMMFDIVDDRYGRLEERLARLEQVTRPLVADQLRARQRR